MEEGFHAGDAFRVQDVVDVLGEIGADGSGGDWQTGGPLGYEGVGIGEAVITGLGEVAGD